MADPIDTRNTLPDNTFAPNKQGWASPEQMAPFLKQWVELARTPSLDDAGRKLLQQLDDILKKNGVWDDVNQNTATAKLAGLSNEDLSNALNGAAGEAGAALNSVSSRTENKISTSETNRTTVNYVDLPTPEEFLDDFTTAYNIHVAGLVQTGAIRSEVAAFARSSDQMQAIFSNYLRERTGRLLKGEPLWKVVGKEADNQLIGKRTGQQADTRTISKDQVSGQQSQGSAGGAPAAAPAAAAGGEASTSTTTTETTTPATDPLASTLTYNDTYNTDETSKFREDEALVSRNKLAVVANLAPLDYLKDSATAQSMNLFYAGEKGTSTRARQTATGGESFASRRL